MNIEKPSFKRICLMHIQALTNFPYIEKDFDAITDYELICKVVDYLNQVIANSNEQNTAITDLYDAFIELKDYVDNYFDNNFPELVNDKLDEMAEDGTLENLLNNRLKLITTYHTFTDVVEDKDTLVNGLIIKTLGYYSINDGGAATYYITNEESETDYQEDFDNGLYGTLIIENYVTPEMLGAKGDGTSDDTLPLQNCFKYFENIKLNNKVYMTNTIFIGYKDTYEVIGNNTTIKRIALNGLDYDNDITHIPYTTILPTFYNYDNWLADRTVRFKKRVFKNINFDNNVGYFTNISNMIHIAIIDIQQTDYIHIDNCSFSNSNQDALSFTGCKKFIVENSSFTNIGISSQVSSRNAIGSNFAVWNPNTSSNITTDCELAIVKNNKFSQIYGEVYGGLLAKHLIIENNNVYQADQYFAELFGNDSLTDKLRLVEIKNNIINGLTNSFITLSSTYHFNDDVKIEFFINNNIIKDLGKLQISDNPLIKSVTVFYGRTTPLTITNMYNNDININIDSSLITSAPLFSITSTYTQNKFNYNNNKLYLDTSLDSFTFNYIFNSKAENDLLYNNIFDKSVNCIVQSILYYRGSLQFNDNILKTNFSGFTNVFGRAANGLLENIDVLINNNNFNTASTTILQLNGVFNNLIYTNNTQTTTHAIRQTSGSTTVVNALIADNFLDGALMLKTDNVTITNENIHDNIVY